jgi:hypothetical protein
MEINSLGFLEAFLEIFLFKAPGKNRLQDFAVRNPEKNLATISSINLKSSFFIKMFYKKIY